MDVWEHQFSGSGPSENWPPGRMGLHPMLFKPIDRDKDVKQVFVLYLFFIQYHGRLILAFNS